MRGWKTEAKMSENFVSQWNYFKENTNLTSRKAAGKARQIRNFFLLKHEVFSVFWFIFNPFSVVNFTEGPQRRTRPANHFSAKIWPAKGEGTPLWTNSK